MRAVTFCSTPISNYHKNNLAHSYNTFNTLRQSLAGLNDFEYQLKSNSSQILIDHQEYHHDWKRLVSDHKYCIENVTVPIMWYWHMMNQPASILSFPDKYDRLHYLIPPKYQCLFLSPWNL